MNQDTICTDNQCLFSAAEIDSIKQLMDLQCSSLPANLRRQLMADEMKRHVGLVLGGSR